MANHAPRYVCPECGRKTVYRVEGPHKNMDGVFLGDRKYQCNGLSQGRCGFVLYVSDKMSIADMCKFDQFSIYNYSKENL